MKNLIYNKIYLCLLFFIIIFQSCSTFYVSSNDDDMSVNEFIYYVMKDVYLWNKNIPDVDFNNNIDPEDFFESLLDKNIDRWSYMYKISDLGVELKYNENIGFGLFPVWTKDITSDWTLKIAYVTKGSPVDKSGLERGDTILKINDLSIEDLEPSDSTSLLISDETTNSNELILSLLDKNNNPKNATIQKTIYQSSPILQTNVFEHNNKKIGYFVFNEFNYTGDNLDDDEYNDNDGIENLFFDFNFNDRIDELIIDLRYNGGGSLYICNYLASLIVGNEKEGNLFFKGICNNRNYENYVMPYYSSSIYYHYNELDTYYRSLAPSNGYFTYSFQHIDPYCSLDLKRIFIITSNMSASASEALINGLKPYIDVVLIGSKTHGKPVGMSPFQYKEYVFYPIMFEGLNSNDEGGFYDGIEVDIPTVDTLNIPLGSTSDPSIQAVFNYLDDISISKRPNNGIKYNYLQYKNNFMTIRNF